jgi:hypothetical protein
VFSSEWKYKRFRLVFWRFFFRIPVPERSPFPPTQYLQVPRLSHYHFLSNPFHLILTIHPLIQLVPRAVSGGLKRSGRQASSYWGGQVWWRYSSIPPQHNALLIHHTPITASSLEHWDPGFESQSRYGYLCCLPLCVGRGLVTGWSPVQGVLPTVYRIKNLTKRPRPKKGLYSHNHTVRVCAVQVLWQCRKMNIMGVRCLCVVDNEAERIVALLYFNPLYMLIHNG